MDTFSFSGSPVPSARGGPRPKHSDPVESYSHFYLSTFGEIIVQGVYELSLDDIYTILCSECIEKNLPDTTKDTLELLLWSVAQSDKTLATCTVGHSTFFGPYTSKKRVSFPQNLFVLTKRKSFPDAMTNYSIDIQSQWELNGSDWIISAKLSGRMKKLSDLDVVDAPPDRVHHYIKCDKYNPYHEMSSFIHPLSGSVSDSSATAAEGANKSASD